MSNLLEDFTQVLKLLVELLKVVSGLLRLPLEDTVGDSDLEVLGQSHEHVLQHLLAPKHTRLFVDHLQVFLDPHCGKIFSGNSLQLK